MPKHFSDDERKILTAQAKALRDGGLYNKRIAEVLHVSITTVANLLKGVPALSARPRGPRGSLLSEEERTKRSTERQRNQQASYIKDGDSYVLRTRLAAYATFEAHGSTNEGLPHEPADIVASVRDALGGMVAWNGHGLMRRAATSDELDWRDEEEEDLPELPSNRYYARYRTQMLRWMARVAKDRERGVPESMIDGFRMDGRIPQSE